jgi:hypothetical protein
MIVLKIKIRTIFFNEFVKAIRHFTINSIDKNVYFEAV